MKKTILLDVIAGSNFVVIENVVKRLTLADGTRDWVARITFQAKHKNGRLIQSRWEGFSTTQTAIDNLISQFEEVSQEEEIT